jgi:4-hydroxybenzoate polyprenyltransferase
MSHTFEEAPVQTIAGQSKRGASTTGWLGPLLRALRPRQWSKNLLVFAALVFSRSLHDPSMVATTVIAFAVFCALSSTGYLVNDLCDVEADRRHTHKAKRPIASGSLSQPIAWAAAAVLGLGALAVGFRVSPAFASIGLVYLVLTLGYSLWLKHIVLVDVFAIAAGFVVRAVAGAVAISVPISPWLYVCTVLGALMITLGKRRHEILLLEREAGTHRPALREYSLELVDQLLVIISSASLMAYSLYTFSADNLPRNHAMMLTIPFVLYGVFRYFFLLRQRGLGGAPEDLLLEDRPLALAVALWAASSVAILYLAS